MVVVAVVGLIVNGDTSEVRRHSFFFFHKIWIKESISYIKLTSWLVRKFSITFELINLYELYGLVNPFELYGLRNSYNSYRLVNPYDLYRLHNPYNSYGLTNPYELYGLTNPYELYGLLNLYNLYEFFNLYFTQKIKKTNNANVPLTYFH